RSSSFIARVARAASKTPVRDTGVSSWAKAPASVGVDLGLALDRGLAGDHGLALQPVQRLGELKVLGAAELGRRLRRTVARRDLGLVLLARFVARLLARLVLDLGALAALQVLLEVGFASAKRREQVAFGGLVEHDVGNDALGLDRRTARRKVARGRDLERGVGRELADRLHRSLAERLRTHDDAALVVLQRTRDDLARRRRALVDEDDE